MTGDAAIDDKEPVIVPRPVVVLIVLVLTALLVADVGAQFLPGSMHEASPVLDGAILAVLGGVVAASRGPKPGTPDPPAPPEPAETGRHRPPGETP